MKWTIAFWFLGITAVGAQDFVLSPEEIQQKYRFTPLKITEGYVLDGRMEEPFWARAPVMDDFFLHDPVLRPHVQPPTEVRVVYNAEGLLIHARMYQRLRPIIQTLRRDRQFWQSDGFVVLLDPNNSRTYGFAFGVNAGGAQMEGIVTSRGFNPVDNNWDNKWFSAVHHTDSTWEAEMFIPFKSLRYNRQARIWGVNFERNYMHRNEYHTWTPVPEQFTGLDFGYTGALVWEEPLPEPGLNMALIPYASVGVEKDEEGQRSWKRLAGGDVKLALTEGLYLDATVNPDFSNVEVDELVTNLTRFSIFLPEKRGFFLENSDLFSSFGTPSIRPFFSRRIGIENGRAVPIVFGARVTGSVHPRLRIGAMNVHVQSDEDIYQNYTAVTFRQTLGSRSGVRGIFLNRQRFDGYRPDSIDYGRDLGGELFYKSDDGKWTAWLEYHRSFKYGYTDHTSFYKWGFIHRSRHWRIVHGWTRVGVNYFTDMGFSRRILHYDAERDTFIRVGYNQNFTFIQYRIYAQSALVNTYELEYVWRGAWLYDWTINEGRHSFNFITRWRSGDEGEIQLVYQWVDLLYPYSFTGGEPLKPGPYGFFFTNGLFKTSPYRLWGLEGQVSAGQFYNGEKYSIKVGSRYRIQPWGAFGLSYEYYHLLFPEPYGSRDIQAVNARIEISFSTQLYWTTLFQFVQQQEFMGINSRLQWRFAPMSDMYLIYIDNYFTPVDAPFAQLHNEGRSFVVKVNYWFSV